LDRMLGGFQSQSGRDGEEKKIPSPPVPGIKPRSSITYPSHCTG